MSPSTSLANGQGLRRLRIGGSLAGWHSRVRVLTVADLLNPRARRPVQRPVFTVSGCSLCPVFTVSG
eukprot:11295371-Alexandrium_andersonii.AAC.1